MPNIKQDECGTWSVVSDDGSVYASGLSNAQAWRAMDRLSGEAVSVSEAAKDFKERPVEPSNREKQEFYSGLIQIGINRGYARGWAWYKFCEKFGHTPEGFSSFPAKPSKSVWGWVNRKAIAASKARA